MRSDKYRTGCFTLKLINHFLIFDFHAEKYAENEIQNTRNNINQKSGNMICLIISHAGTIPKFFMYAKHYERYPSLLYIFACALPQIIAIISSIYLPVESIQRASSAGRKGEVSRLESNSSRRTISARTSL